MLLMFLSLTALAACKDSAGKVLPCKTITPGAVFKAKLGETWCADDGKLKITFQNISDSRCNVDRIKCFWAGNASLFLEIEEAGKAPYPDTLTTDETWKGSLEIRDRTLSLLEIRPLQRDSFVIIPAAYSFDLVLE